MSQFWVRSLSRKLNLARVGLWPNFGIGDRIIMLVTFWDVGFRCQAFVANPCHRCIFTDFSSLTRKIRHQNHCKPLVLNHFGVELSWKSSFNIILIILNAKNSFIPILSWLNTEWLWWSQSWLHYFIFEIIFRNYLQRLSIERRLKSQRAWNQWNQWLWRHLKVTVKKN